MVLPRLLPSDVTPEEAMLVKSVEAREVLAVSPQLQSKFALVIPICNLGRSLYGH